MASPPGPALLATDKGAGGGASAPCAGSTEIPQQRVIEFIHTMPRVVHFGRDGVVGYESFLGGHNIGPPAVVRDHAAALYDKYEAAGLPCKLSFSLPLQFTTVGGTASVVLTEHGDPSRANSKFPLYSKAAFDAYAAALAPFASKMETHAAGWESMPHVESPHAKIKEFEAYFAGGKRLRRE